MPVTDPPVIGVFETPFRAVFIGFNNTGAEDSNTLYRTDPKGNKVRLSREVPANGSYYDFHTRSGVQYQYEARAIRNGEESALSNMVSASKTLDCATIHQVAKRAGTNNADSELNVVELFNLEGQTTTITREANILRLASTEKPRIKTSPLTQTIIECPIIIPRRDLATMIYPFEEMLWSNDLWCFRDPMGELIFCTFPSQETHTDINLECTIIMWESDYKELMTIFGQSFLSFIRSPIEANSGSEE
jgi:hypothetical protein